MKKLALALGLTTTISCTALAQEPARKFQTEKAPVNAEIMVSGLSNPWGLDFLPDGTALVTERTGALRIFDGKQLSPPVKGVPDAAVRGQGGLLDVAVAPDFAQSGLIYLSYSQRGDGGAGTAVARAKLERSGAGGQLSDLKIIYSMDKKTSAGQHFGSRIVPRPDGTLFVTTGDRGERDRAQDMQDTAGAVLRMNSDGSIPVDNPYADGKAAAPQIWSKGHRNVQGATFDPVTNNVITVEHGAQGGDEINRPEAGKNYGWPVITYGVDYSGAKIGSGTSAQGYEQPLHYWDPSIAPSGLAVYDGEMFPEWKGDLLVGALKFQLLSRLERDETGKIEGEERMLANEYGRIRDVNVAPDGSVWLLTDDENGSIVRLSRGI